MKDHAVNEDQLLWWLTITEILEREDEHSQMVFRWRLSGLHTDECRKRLIALGRKGITKERVRQIYARVLRKIQKSMTPPTA